MTPPSELIRPPSKAAVIFLRSTAGKQNGRRLSLVMAGVACLDPGKGSASAVLAETRPDSRCWLFDPCGTCHPFSSSHQFLLCERERVKKGPHRGLAQAP